MSDLSIITQQITEAKSGLLKAAILLEQLCPSSISMRQDIFFYSFPELGKEDTTLLVRDIQYFKTEGNYCHFNVLHEGEKFVFTECTNMKEVMTVLKHVGFLQTDQSWAVNQLKVRGWTRDYKHLLMHNGDHVYVSRSHVEELKKYWPMK